MSDTSKVPFRTTYNEQRRYWSDYSTRLRVPSLGLSEDQMPFLLLCHISCETLVPTPFLLRLSAAYWLVSASSFDHVVSPSRCILRILLWLVKGPRSGYFPALYTSSFSCKTQAVFLRVIVWRLLFNSSFGWPMATARLTEMFHVEQFCYRGPYTFSNSSL